MSEAFELGDEAFGRLLGVAAGEVVAADVRNSQRFNVNAVPYDVPVNAPGLFVFDNDALVTMDVDAAALTTLIAREVATWGPLAKEIGLRVQ